MAINFEEFASRKELVAHLKQEGLIKTTNEASAWIINNVPLEKVFQAKIMNWLKEQKTKRTIPNMFLYKQQAGVYQRQGLPDITAIIDGQYFGFEVKRPFIGATSPIQEETIKEIFAAGGHAYVVSFVSEVREILQAEGKLKTSTIDYEGVDGGPHIRKDCPGYTKDGCRILTTKGFLCEKQDCGFYPPTAEKRKDQIREKRAKAAEIEAIERKYKK
jgi:hypothetical protein